MFPITTQRIISADSTTAIGPFELKNLEGFPYTDWTNMRTRYGEFDNWYSGKALNQKITNETTGEEVDKYPIHLNPIPNTCEKHTVVLLGTNLESIREGNLPIRFTVTKKKKVGMDEKEAPTRDPNLETIEQALIDAFQDNGAGAMFAANGVLSQYKGGCVFGVSWDPASKGNKVQVFIPFPQEFLGIPSGTNPWLLREAWFIREISIEEAKNYGYTPNELETKCFYIEHWTEEEYSVQINNQVVRIKVGDSVFAYKGVNPFGVVPYVYIPHLRVDGYYGESIINETIKGLVKEMNLRFADTGDAVSDDSHSELALRQVRESIRSVTLPSGKRATNLGTSPGIAASEKEPDLFAVTTSSTSEPMLKFGDKLENLYRKEARHPAVADGEDEGSQRSSLTLTTRMWPLVAHVDLERMNWTTGLIKLARIILTMCSVKGVYGITDELIANYEISVKWALTLPRDRDQLVNEIAIRKKNKLGSTSHLLTLFDDIEDVDDELAKIRAEIEEEAARAMELRESSSAGSQDTQGGGKKEPAAREKQPSAKNIPSQE